MYWFTEILGSLYVPFEACFIHATEAAGALYYQVGAAILVFKSPRNKGISMVDFEPLNDS